MVVFLDLEQQANAGEVQSSLLREEPDQSHALNIQFRVQTDSVTAGGGHQAALLVDPERSRVASGKIRGNADHVDRRVRCAFLH